MPNLNLFLSLILLFTVSVSRAQEPAQDKLNGLPGRFVEGISKKAAHLEKKLKERSEKALQKMYNNERRLRKQLSKIDSTKAKEIFSDIDALYRNPERLLKKRRPPQPYMPALDTLTGAVEFLEQSPGLLASNNNIRAELSKAANNIHELKDQFSKADNIRNFLKERRQYLKERLLGMPLARSMTKMNKDIYYYSQAIGEYRNILQDRKKIERKALALLSKTSALICSFGKKL